jgi:hypothetical protein
MHLHDRIISLTAETWTHTTILTLPLFIEVLGPNTESERSCIFVLQVSILPLSMIFLFVFGEFYRHSGIFFFIFFGVNNILSSYVLYYKEKQLKKRR